MGLFDKLRNKLNPDVISRLGDDFRQAGSWVGTGVSGMILLSDGISIQESGFMIVFGLVLWIIGHISIYISEKIRKK